MSRTDRREALLARFRSGSLTRIADVLAKLEMSAPLTAEQLSELHVPLHTLKGEARMLGLGSLAALVHEVEGRLADASREQASLDRVHAAVALIQERLHAPLLDDREAENALQRGRGLLGSVAGEPDVEPAIQPAIQPSAVPGASSHASESTDADGSVDLSAPASRRREPVFSTIRAELLDELCERIEALRVGLGRANAAGKPSGGRDDVVRQELAELAELAWGLRLVPVEPALENLSEHASELAAQLGKPLRVRIDAGGAALERSLLERLQEPLMHLVHNAIDHGIEPRGERVNKPTVARVEIIARSVGPEVEVTVLDDGRGVDLERVRRRARERGLLDEAAAAAAGPDELFGLLFESGFSTRATVSELSGRGVGLDAVRRAVESLGGEVAVSSEPGRGARFSLRVPATISRETVIVIELGGTLWGLPSRRVGPVVSLGREGQLGRAPTITVDGKYVPVLSLARLLGLSVEVESRVAICCSHAGRRYALASPKVLGEFELFRRPMGPVLSAVGLATASAVMDDGQLVLLLEPTTLLGQRLRRDTRDLRPVAVKTRARVLVVDDSPIIRDLLVELLTAAKLDVHTAADGAEALEVLDRHRVDLVLSDVEMPGIDGFELLTRVRQRDPDLPVVMVTTRGSIADRERATALGANAYLVKSEFRDRDMLDAIARFVEVAR
jgi:chemotaxis protein histidine kinase CheA